MFIRSFKTVVIQQFLRLRSYMSLTLNHMQICKYLIKLLKST